MSLKLSEISEFIGKYNRVKPYINDQRFKKMCLECGIDNWYKEFKAFENYGLAYVINAPIELVNAILKLDNDIQEGIIFCKIADFKDIRKVVFEDNTFEEVDLSLVEGLQYLLKLYETKKVKLILRLTDTIEKMNVKTNIFDGDIVKCFDEWHSKTTMILACLNKNYIYPEPYYLELLFTEKYGYLTAKGEPNKDTSEALMFEESIYNAKNSHMNYHSITLTAKWEVIGNIYIDYSVLKPLKQ